MERGLKIGEVSNFVSRDNQPVIAFTPDIEPQAAEFAGIDGFDRSTAQWYVDTYEWLILLRHLAGDGERVFSGFA